MEPKKKLVILGATGSIGASALDVIRHREDIRVVGLACDANVDALVRASREFEPDTVALSDPAAADRASEALRGTGVRVLDGADGVSALARSADADLILNGIVGSAGLLPTIAALEAGHTLGLANKESLVTAGALVKRTARSTGATLLPIDSEHCSLFQCLQGRPAEAVRHIILTASGGPFRTRSLEEVDRLPAEEALRHPTWNMGPRITVDSATLMNKGFEVIEAHWLFDMPPERIRVVVHPQSIVHAAAVLSDGSLLAHLGPPDMRLPIEYVISWPEPPTGRFESLDLAAVGSVEFEEPDHERFPCLGLALEALARGGTMPAALNAADEVAVSAYLDGRIRFTEIPRVISETMAAHEPRPAEDVKQILTADAWARDKALTLARGYGKEGQTCPTS